MRSAGPNRWATHPGPTSCRRWSPPVTRAQRPPGETDWKRIAGLYRDLGVLNPSPVIELNRAMAVSRAEGPAAGTTSPRRPLEHPELARYHLLPAARAELLEALGRLAEASGEFQRAANLTLNARQRARLEARAAACRR
jgi:predicted RNA polymerase sigma factor